MKIVVTSDLHLGITAGRAIRALAERIAAEAPALTVLAGDLGEPLPDFAACLELFAGLPGDVAVLAGNHDVWARGGHHSRDLWERELPAAVRARGMLWLEDADWHGDGVAVVGTISWYDYSAADPDLPHFPPERFAQLKGRFNNDARFVDWPWSDTEFAARVGDSFHGRLLRVESDPDVRAIVIATHVPLFEAQMCRKPHDQAWGFSNAYFGNLALGRRVLDASKVRAVVSGHTHVGRSGYAPRGGDPDADLPPIPVAVVPSAYGAPAYLTVDVP
jgi:hypothetical protein